MTVITEDVTITHMSSTQLMSECWSLGVDYAGYKSTAELHGKHAYTEAEYKSHCESMDEQARQYCSE